MLALKQLVPDTKYMVHCHNYPVDSVIRRHYYPDTDPMDNDPGSLVWKTFLGLTLERPEFVAGAHGETCVDHPDYIQIYPASIPYKQELMQRSVLRKRRVVHSVLMENTPLPHDLQREILSYLFPVKQYQEIKGVSRVVLDTKRHMKNDT
jgi:hypothetical protein